MADLVEKVARAMMPWAFPEGGREYPSGRNARDYARAAIAVVLREVDIRTSSPVALNLARENGVSLGE